MLKTSDRRTHKSPLVRSGRPRTLVGYGWPWTVRPGERIEFKVSSQQERAYRADLVRIRCADDLSSPPMFKEEECSAPFAGSYPGRTQSVHTGSYIEIDSKPYLSAVESFTIQAMIFPTALPKMPARPKASSPLATPHPNQHLISRWDDSTGCGWSLFINKDNRVAFVIGNGETRQEISVASALIQNHWFFVVASYDSIQHQVRIDVQLLARTPCELLNWRPSHVQERCAKELSPIQSEPLRFAASAGGPGNGSRRRPAGCFNGKLDRVRLCKGVIHVTEARLLAGSTIPESLRGSVVGFWDFGRGIDTIEIRDLSGNGLHGVAINVPTRGVAGIDWDGSSCDWRQRPDHYSAIHFHDDDLYDAEWKTDFRYYVPQGLRSGIYAVRLRQGEAEDYIPFFVAPSRGTATARVALLLPTTTYTAYANIPWLNKTYKRRFRTESGEWKIIDQEAYPCILRKVEDEEFIDRELRGRGLGKGVYLHHTDGSHCDIASQKYPNMAFKPKTRNWTLGADTYLTDWLENLGVAYDVITDDLLHAEGVELLKPYTVVITGNHPEYCSAPMLGAISEYQQQGGRLMYLGGNGFFWLTSYHPQLPGAIEVRKDFFYAGIHPPFEIRHAFDGRSGGLWSRNGRAPQLLVGIGTVFPLPFEASSPYERLPDSYDQRSKFIFEGVTAEVFGDYGSIGGGAAGQEVDEIDYAQGTPAHALHLARSRDFPWPMLGPDGMTAEEYRDNVKMPRADMVFFEGPRGGAVFSVGSMAWVGALSHDGYSNDVARITENVLRRFLDKTPFSVPEAG